MGHQNTYYKIPIWRQTPGSRRDSSRIQLNPASAFAQSDAKLALKSWAVTGSMLAVLAILLVGGLTSVQQQQKTTVEASLNLKRALIGTVVNVDSENNRFVLSLVSSLDEKIIRSAISEWTIQLPPGESFDESRRRVSIRQSCYRTADIRKSMANASPEPCADVIKLRQEILVEYLILNPQDGSIVAKTIVGQ